MHDQLYVLILAAGKGSRMRSPLPKPMLPVGGQPMLSHVIAATQALHPEKSQIVIGPQMDEMRDYAAPIECVVQQQRLGTGHAVQVALNNMPETRGTLLILNGDVPLIETATLEQFFVKHQSMDAVVSVLGFETNTPGAYGRMITDQNDLNRIVEAKDASEEERRVQLCNGGIYALDLKYARNLLAELSTNNAAGELYLTDIVAHAREAGLHCAFDVASEAELSGANTPEELAILDQRFRSKKEPFLSSAEAA